MTTCHLVSHSNSAHLSQVYTGFSLLQRAGEISLSQECRKHSFVDVSKPQHLRDARHAHLLVIVNDNIRINYDCHDSYEIDEHTINEGDYYFKRSYMPSTIPSHLKGKVFPLGLNYEVYPTDPDDFELQRRSFLQRVHVVQNGPLFRPVLENMCSLPNRQPKGVLFMTRAWDPFDVADRSEEKRAERIQINETRAQCIELLRKQFGNHFLGGFLRTDFAVRNYGGLLVQDPKTPIKENYIALLKEHAICIATTGLHGSIGWKMGEYVAFSKAIVSERLNYQVPGDFSPTRNYLEFSEPKRCVEAVDQLLSNPDVRYRMMEANYSYYLGFLKPDVMIRRTLNIGLSTERSDAELGHT